MVRVFEKPNIAQGWRCPLCNTNEDKQVVLVGIRGTEEGNIMQAEQIHLDCLNLLGNKTIGVIYQEVKGMVTQEEIQEARENDSAEIFSPQERDKGMKRLKKLQRLQKTKGCLTFEEFQKVMKGGK